MTELVDTFGRVHRDLRIAVTDRCNFRCQYCMPEEGMKWMPREGLLTFEEIERIAGLLVNRYGVDSIRLTGGEPTVRAKLPRLVGMLSGLGVDLAMTTNGATLRLVADELKAAATEMQAEVQQAQQRLSRARNDKSEAEQEAAMKQLQQLQAEQAEKLKQIAARLQAQITVVEQLKSTPSSNH